MATKFNVNEVPEKITAPWLKAFFQEKFGIPVRVRSLKHYVDVWIPSDRSPENLHKLVHHHDFPAELGNLCMRTVYAGNEKLREQSWGGNIGSHSISMFRSQWRKVLGEVILLGNHFLLESVND